MTVPGRSPAFGDRIARSLAAASAIGVITVALALTVADYANLARETVETVRSRADTLALNASAAIAFNDRQHAVDALATLRPLPDFAAAAVFDASGAPLASYAREGDPAPPLRASAPGLERRGRWLLYSMPVRDRGLDLGQLELVYDLRRAERRVLTSLLVALGVGGLAMLVALAAAGRLKRGLVRPIDELVATARTVSQGGDYGLRAKRFADDELGQFTSVFNDMLEQIERQQRELRESNAERAGLLEGERAARSEAERASRMKDEFLATLSHELRTPLMPIVGWIEILRLPGLGSGEREKGLEVIERNARLQARMIDELLDMSRIVSGKLQIEPQRMALGPVIEAAVATVRPAATAKGVAFNVRLPQPGPAVLGDASRLQQVFWNLLSNAVKFTPKGGQVDVELLEEGDDVRVRVADSGQGIAPEFLPHVFERFRQADSSITRRHGGLGIGLAIVRQLVDLHGGTVRAESAGVDRGALFEVSLPRAAAAAPELAASSESTASRRLPADAPLADLTLLAIDDHADARELLTRLLQQAGALVLVAASSAEGLSLLSRARPDAVICDIGMPDGDGYGFIRGVRELPAERGGSTPAIALTAFARTEDRARALEAGYDLHLPKPIEGGALVAAVARLVALRARSA